MTINPNILQALAFVGIFTLVAGLLRLKTLVHYLKFKTFPKTLEEEKISLLKTENVRLSDKIQQLERESEEMTRAVLQQLR